MDLLIHQLLSGFATGGIYAIMALALVMIYQATHEINFAQGEMAMFSTYLAWWLIDAQGMPYWWAFLITVAVSFVAGIAIERIIIRPVQNAPILAIVTVFIGLLVIFNSIAGWVFSVSLRSSSGPSKQSREMEKPRASSISSKTCFASGKRSATSLPIPAN